MNFIELIFAILKRFVPISSERKDQLEVDALAWYKDKVKMANEDSPAFLKMLKEKGELWYIQVGLAISYIFLVKEIKSYMSAPIEEEEENQSLTHW